MHAHDECEASSGESVLRCMLGVVQLVVLSDRISEGEMDIKQPPIPTLLAVGAVHHHLIRFPHPAAAHAMHLFHSVMLL